MEILPPALSAAATRVYECAVCRKQRAMRDDESIGTWRMLTNFARTWWFCSRKCQRFWESGMGAAGTVGASIRIVPTLQAPTTKRPQTAGGKGK